MRLIDAEILFEKVGNIKPKNKSEYELLGKFMNMITCSPTVENPQWIPCSERLPDDGGVFLVTTVGKSFNGENDIYIVEVMSLWHKDGHLEWRDNFVFESAWCNKKVVAWMPLPSAYEKEGVEINEIQGL